MSRRRRQVRDQRGQTVEGTVINVQESTERWTDVRLVNGTTFRVKVVVDEVVVHDGQRDSEGNPVYSIFSHNVVNDVQSVDTVRHIGDK